MPRQPRLRKKNGYWYTEAGGSSGTYFGRVDDVSHLQAKAKFAAHLTEIAVSRPVNGVCTVATLFNGFLAALTEHRSNRTYSERKLHVDRFLNFRRDGVKLGTLGATGITASDLTDFLKSIAKEFSLDPLTVHKHATSVVAAFNWGAGNARLKNPSPSLPAGFRPFAQVERYKVPLNELHEDELPTRDEVDAIFKWADTDIGQIYEKGRWRARRPEERREGAENPYRGFNDLLRIYYHTGARTSELADCDVRDCIHGSKQIVLGSHKRSKTLRDAVSRRITLNPEAYAIVKRACQGRGAQEPIFLNPRGTRWSRHTLDRRFSRVRKLAGVRDEITIYSFRHLWMSEALMNGVDISTTARMAGTSVLMVERVYGHLSGQHMADAQTKLDEGRQKQANLSK